MQADNKNANKSEEEAIIDSIAARESQKSAEQKAHDKEKCEQYVKNGLKRDVTVQFLFERLLQLGCRPPENLIRCVDCGTKPIAGGFGVVEEIDITDETKKSSSQKANSSCTQTQEEINKLIAKQNDGNAKLKLLPDIFLCQQNIQNETHARESMAHELIHAIDMCRTKMDPINNCIHMACTEIRAENLAGECHWVRELQRGRMGTNFVGHGAECVKRRAIRSVKANPNCAEKAAEYVDAAFDRCFKDTFPFDRHPNLR
jgi:inner membrane protease ATP23